VVEAALRLGLTGLLSVSKVSATPSRTALKRSYRLRMGEVAESEHHDAATVPSADHAITCRRRLALNVLEH
jgi:hypothetical protein